MDARTVDVEETEVEAPMSNTNAEVVAKHYNTIEEKGLSHRNRSRILHLRNFNNWIKSMLINEFLEKVSDSRAWRPQTTVLDLACGKGGDLLKWRQGKIKHLICSDIAEQSIEDCKNRYKDMQYKSNNIYTSEFIVADLTKKRIRTHFKDPTIKIDLVSCQFAFHYCFESLPQAECMLRNVSECLRKGGYFIGTMPNAYDIVARLKNSDENNFGNEVFKISFEDEIAEKLPLFGAKYNFQLEGVVDCPEFLVHFPTLNKLAEKYGLKLVKKASFEEFYKESLQKGKFLMNKMSALETYPSLENEGLSGAPEDYILAQTFLETNSEVKCVGTLSKPEWDAASLYMIFVFEKFS